MADAIWHVGIQGERKGPFTEEDIKGMIERAELTARDVIWKEGMEEWLPVGQVEPFVEAMKTAPPPPVPIPTQANPVLAWLETFWLSLRAVILNPSEGTASVSDKKDVSFAGALVGAGVLIFALLWYQAMRLTAGAFGAGGEIGFKVFLKGIFFGIVLAAVWFGALILVMQAMLKVPTNWIDALMILGIAAIPFASVGLVVFALNWATAYFYLLLICFAMPASLLLLYTAFVHTTKVSHRAAMYIIPTMCLATEVVFGIILKILI